MSKKILIVDDETHVRSALRRFLAAKGYEVAEAQNGLQALEAYEEDRPHVVLLDVRMPQKDGLETLRDLKAIDPEVSVIMVTAVHEEDIARLAMEKGAFDYITKPIDPDYLELSLMTKIALLGA